MLTEHETRLLLLTPTLGSIHPSLPRLAWRAAHGDATAMDDMLSLLGACHPRQTARVLGLLWFHSAGCGCCGGSACCERCGAPTDGKGNCFICDRTHIYRFPEGGV
jgi:hypothetical protein